MRQTLCGAQGREICRRLSVAVAPRSPFPFWKAASESPQLVPALASSAGLSAANLAAPCHELTARSTFEETSAAVWKTRRSQVGRVAAWVLTVARHRAIDIARRNGRDCAHQTTDDRLDGLRERSDVPSVAAAHALRNIHHILSLLAQLPDAQREVITSRSTTS